MQWSDFRDTAERLVQGSTEGDWRSGVSRAYYAVFHYFHQFLQLNGLDVGRSGQSHFNLYSGLLNCGFPQVAAIASGIDGLRAHRVWADYDLARPVSRRAAQTAVRQSSVLITDFQNVLANLPAAQIADGARKHLLAIGRVVP
jgi:uncharacterized protein (UPF0332 family)